MQNAVCAVDVIGAERCLWRYTVKTTGRTLNVAPPVYEVDEQRVGGALARVGPLGAPEPLPDGTTQYIYSGQVIGGRGLVLDTVFRIAQDNPVVRVRYRLRGSGEHVLTRRLGGDTVDFMSLSLADTEVCTELRTSAPGGSVNSHRYAEYDVPANAFEHGRRLVGPVLIAGDDEHTMLVAYDHRPQVPDAGLTYRLAADRSVTLCATTGAYDDGQAVHDAHPYETGWMRLAVIAGDRAMLVLQLEIERGDSSR